MMVPSLWESICIARSTSRSVRSLFSLCCTWSSDHSAASLRRSSAHFCMTDLCSSSKACWEQGTQDGEKEKQACVLKVPKWRQTRKSSYRLLSHKAILNGGFNVVLQDPLCLELSLTISCTETKHLKLHSGMEGVSTLNISLCHGRTSRKEE